MNLMHELLNAGVHWTIEPCLGTPRGSSRREVPMVVVKVHFQEGPPIEKQFRADYDLALNNLLSIVLAGDARVAALMLRWHVSRGNVTVCASEELSNPGGFFKLAYRGLRKKSKGAWSHLTLEALPRLHPYHRDLFWAKASEVVREAFSAGHPYGNRRLVATELRSAVAEFFQDTATHIGFQPSLNERAISAADIFTFNALKYATSMTPIEDWMWGWLGLAVEDVFDQDGLFALQVA